MSIFYNNDNVYSTTTIVAQRHIIIQFLSTTHPDHRYQRWLRTSVLRQSILVSLKYCNSCCSMLNGIVHILNIVLLANK